MCVHLYTHCVIENSIFRSLSAAGVVFPRTSDSVAGHVGMFCSLFEQTPYELLVPVPVLQCPLRQLVRPIFLSESHVSDLGYPKYVEFCNKDVMVKVARCNRLAQWLLWFMQDHLFSIFLFQSNILRIVFL